MMQQRWPGESNQTGLIEQTHTSSSTPFSAEIPNQLQTHLLFFIQTTIFLAISLFYTINRASMEENMSFPQPQRNRLPCANNSQPQPTMSSQDLSPLNGQASQIPTPPAFSDFLGHDGFSNATLFYGMSITNACFLFRFF